MESNQDFKLPDIIKSFKEDLARVSNPQGIRGRDPYGLLSSQLEFSVSTVSKNDIEEIIQATQSKTSWEINRDVILKKLNLVTKLTSTEKGIVFRILLSLFVSAASKKIITFNGSHCFHHLFIEKKPYFLLKDFPFAFCYSRFALELVNVASEARFNHAKEFLNIDWSGVEEQHINHRPWLKATSDIFCYMCAYGVEGYLDITPATLNKYRISRSELGFGTYSYSPVFRFIDGKYNTTLDFDTKKIVLSNKAPSLNKNKSLSNGHEGYKSLTPNEKIECAGDFINKEAVVLEPYSSTAIIALDDYSFALSSLKSFVPSEIDEQSKWSRSQLDYLKSDAPEANTLKQRGYALCYLNAYLFNYLPYFFANTDTVFQYPDNPEKFLAHVFVKKSMVMDEFISGETNKKIYPLSLIDFIVLCTENKKRVSTEGNNLARDTLAVINRYFTHVITFYSHLEGYKLNSNPLSVQKKKYGKAYSKSVKTKFAFQYWVYFRHFIKVVSKYAVLHASIEVNRQAEKYNLQDVVAVTDTIAKDVLALIDNDKVTLASIKKSKINNDSILIDDEINLSGNLKPLKIGTLDFTGFNRKTIQLSDSGVNAKHINYQAFAELAVKCYSAQRASNAAWLCADTFDADYDPDNTLLNENLVDIRIFTDKVSPTGLGSKVPKEIMELLIIIRGLRSLNKNKAFSEPIYYQNNKDSKKGKLKPLLQTTQNQAVEFYNLTPFIKLFEKCLEDSGIEFQSTLNYCLKNMKSIEFDFLKRIDQVPFSYTYKIRNLPGERFIPFFSVTKKTSITGHSLRVMLDSVLDVLVDDREAIRMFTGQTDATIGYYAQNTPEEEQEIRASAKDLIPELVTPIQAQIDEKEVTEAQFSGTFVQDFRPISTHITAEIGSGIDDIDTCDELALNWTHICPFGNNCPNEVVRTIGRMKCHLCPKAIMFKKHGPAIAAKIRTLFEEISDIYTRLAESGVSKADVELYNFQTAEKVLEASSWKVRHDLLESQNLVVLDSKGVLDNMTYLKPGSFKESLYYRLKEVADIPALQSDKLRRMAERISRKLNRVIPDLPTLIDFEKENLHENPVAHALRTLEIVAELQGTTVEKLLEAPVKQKYDNELLGVFQ